MGRWEYEEVALKDVKSTAKLLVRILIAKVEDETRLLEIMRTTPVVQNDPNWRCRTWIMDVFSRLSADEKALGTSESDWTKIESVARSFVAEKTDAGRYEKYDELFLPKPTWDMLQGKELVN